MKLIIFGNGFVGNTIADHLEQNTANKIVRIDPKYFDTKFYLRLQYDDDVILPDYKYIDGVRTKVGSGKFIQVNQNFGIGFVFHF